MKLQIIAFFKWQALGLQLLYAMDFAFKKTNPFFRFSFSTIFLLIQIIHCIMVKLYLWYPPFVCAILPGNSLWHGLSASTFKYGNCLQLQLHSNAT